MHHHITQQETWYTHSLCEYVKYKMHFFVYSICINGTIIKSARAMLTIALRLALVTLHVLVLRGLLLSSAP